MKQSYGRIWKERNRWRGRFSPPGSEIQVDYFGSTCRGEVEYALAVVKAEYLKERLIDELGIKLATSLVKQLKLSERKR